MLWRVLKLIVVILMAILEAEGKLGPKTGAQKKTLVTKIATAELDASGLLAELPSCSLDEIMQHILQVVNAVVALLNCFGVFRHG